MACEPLHLRLSRRGNRTNSFKDILYLEKEDYEEYIRPGKSQVIDGGKVWFGPWEVRRTDGT